MRPGGRSPAKAGRIRVLDRTADIAADAETAPSEEAPARPGHARLEWLGLLRRARHFFITLSLSSLTRRIVSLPLAGMLNLVVGIIYLSQFRANLIVTRVQSLTEQAVIIAKAIAPTTVEADTTITFNPNRLLELPTGETYFPSDDLAGIEFPINPERVAPKLLELISPTKARARVYDRDGVGSDDVL